MKILFFGYFGYRTNQLDGQTVKTRDLYRLFQEHVSDVNYFDSQNFKYSKWTFFVFLKQLSCCRTLIYLPAHNNLKYIFPFIYVLSKIFRFKILYFVVGGWLVEYLKNKPLHRWMLKNISGILTETNLMSDSLYSDYGFLNVKVFPNFRFISRTPIEYHISGKLQIVFLARINKMKGLDTMFSLANYIDKTYGKNTITIDFYGPIYQPDSEYFYEELKKYHCVKYRGELLPEKINETIERYDVMVLPTHYYTEGLPGSVIDAYMSGIPIVVSKWKHATEFVKDGVTGFIIPFESGEEKLIEIINMLFSDSILLQELKKHAREERIKYTSEYAWQEMEDLFSQLEK